MNAVEIESALSDLATFGNNNASDMAGGVLLRNNIHIAVCKAGAVDITLQALRASPATAPRPKPSLFWLPMATHDHQGMVL